MKKRRIALRKFRLEFAAIGLPSGFGPREGAEASSHWPTFMAVVVAAMLPNKSNVSLRQRVQPNQLSLIRREGQQFKAF